MAEKVLFVPESEDCGSCPGPFDECQQGQCICQGESDSDLCLAESAECGQITTSDQCGDSRTIGCGSCTGANETCTGNNECQCQPGSVAEFCDANGAECGQYSGTDRCGNTRTEDCGGCGLLQGCNGSNQCIGL